MLSEAVWAAAAATPEQEAFVPVSALSFSGQLHYQWGT